MSGSLVLDTIEIRKRVARKTGAPFTQGALAEIAHVDQSTVSYWERGKNGPSRAAAALIGQFCEERGIKPAYKPSEATAA